MEGRLGEKRLLKRRKSRMPSRMEADEMVAVTAPPAFHVRRLPVTDRFGIGLPLRIGKQ